MDIALIDAVWEGTPFEGPPGMAKAKEIGFDAIDVAFDPVDQSAAVVQQLVDDVRTSGLAPRSVVCVALGFAGDYHPSVQRFHVDRVKQHLDLAAQLGARNILLVIGEYVWQQEIIPPAQQWADAVRNARDVSMYAGSLDLEIALELEPWRFAFLNSITKAVRFMDEVGVESCKANLDLSHLWPMGAAPEEIRLLAGRICHVHIADCDGKVYRSLPPGRGTAPLHEYFVELVGTGYDGTVSVELEPAPAGEDAEAWVREAYVETVKLIHGAGGTCGP